MWPFRKRLNDNPVWCCHDCFEEADFDSWDEFEKKRQGLLHPLYGTVRMDNGFCNYCNNKWNTKRKEKEKKQKEIAHVVAGSLGAQQNMRGEYLAPNEVAERAMKIAEAMMKFE